MEDKEDSQLFLDMQEKLRQKALQLDDGDKYSAEERKLKSKERKLLDQIQAVLKKQENYI